MTKKEEIIEISTDPEIEITNVTVSSLIHIIRGKQVILDSDLAMLYGYEKCQHVFKDGKCIKCLWDGSRSEYIRSMSKSF